SPRALVWRAAQDRQDQVAPARLSSPVFPLSAEISVLTSVDGADTRGTPLRDRGTASVGARLRRAGRLVGLELGATDPDVHHRDPPRGEHGRTHRGAVRYGHRSARIAADLRGRAALGQDDDPHRAPRLPAAPDPPDLRAWLGGNVRLS